MVAGLWFHQLRAGSRSGGQWAALVTHAGEAPAELGGRGGAELGKTRATQNLTCQSQGLCPDSQQDCQGYPVQTPPTTSTHSWEAVPGRPTA